MTPIDKLDDAEAVYTLYMAADGKADDVDLGDPAALEAVVRAACESVAGPEAAGRLLESLRNDQGAAALARTCLATLAAERALAPGIAAQIDDLLADPPQAEKMDMGLSLSLLGLGAIAMALMGSLEISHEEEKSPGGKSKRATRVKWTGSQNVPKVVTALLAAIGVKGT